jgi:glycosyltransferase involved in cell wall biosynthesis
VGFEMRLTVFLTHSLSLQTWHEQGIFDRELAIYRKLQDKGVEINLVSYGGRDEYDFSSQIPDMRILCNWIGWSEKRYTHRLHQLHGWRLWQSDVYKTNQLNGAQVAVRASKLWKRPLIVRFGFLWSAFAEQNHAPDSVWVQRIHRIQNEAFQHANRVVMTSPLMLDDVRKLAPTIDDKVTIIPNYVDTDLFCSLDQPKVYDLVFVGRVTEQKNLHNLLSAIRGTAYTLAIAGDGDLRDSLQQEFSDLDAQVHCLGRIPHPELPKLINQGRVFILPSHYEGHPKSLIEAMACGVPVIGTRVRGIKQVIEHEVNGVLCEPDNQSLLQTINSVLSKPDLMTRIGENARQFAVEQYSLDQIAQKEYDLLCSVASHH